MMVEAVVVTISMVHMVVIGVNRFIAVVLPLRYSTLVTKKTVMVMVLMCWCIPVIWMVPLQVYASAQKSVLANNKKFEDAFLAVNSTVWFLLLIIIMVILYSKILSETRAQAQRVQAWQQRAILSTTTAHNTTGQSTAGHSTTGISLNWEDHNWDKFSWKDHSWTEHRCVKHNCG